MLLLILVFNKSNSTLMTTPLIYNKEENH